jgi:hypothetical protein
MGMKYIQSGKVLQIRNIKDKLMGVHYLGFRSSQYPQSIEFLWVDTYLEDSVSEPQYRIGFNYMGIEYSSYLHTLPMYNDHEHYRMNLYGPNMNVYNSFYFHYSDFFSPTEFILSLIRQIDANN